MESSIGRELRTREMRTSDTRVDLRFYWLAAFLFLQLIDLVTTTIGLSSGLSEGNPLANGLLGLHGIGGMYAWKFALIGLTVLTVCSLGNRLRKLWWVIRIGTVIMLPVMLLNIVQVTILA